MGEVDADLLGVGVSSADRPAARRTVLRPLPLKLSSLHNADRLADRPRAPPSSFACMSMAVYRRIDVPRPFR